MSIDFNTIINSAITEATKKRNAAATTANSMGNMTSMAASGRGSELSMEDIAAGMKANSSKKHEDNKFITTNGKAFKIVHDVDTTTAVGASVQDKISAVQRSTEKSLNRQAEVAQSLKDYQNKPFAT